MSGDDKMSSGAQCEDLCRMLAASKENWDRDLELIKEERDYYKLMAAQKIAKEKKLQKECDALEQQIVLIEEIMFDPNIPDDQWIEKLKLACLKPTVVVNRTRETSPEKSILSPSEDVDAGARMRTRKRRERRKRNSSNNKNKIA